MASRYNGEHEDDDDDEEEKQDDDADDVIVFVIIIVKIIIVIIFIIIIIKAHSAQACAVCAFSLEANAIASISCTSIVDHLVGSGGWFMPPIGAPFPDGV